MHGHGVSFRPPHLRMNCMRHKLNPSVSFISSESPNPAASNDIKISVLLYQEGHHYGVCVEHNDIDILVMTLSRKTSTDGRPYRKIGRLKKKRRYSLSLVLSLSLSRERHQDAEQCGYGKRCDYCCDSLSFCGFSLSLL